MAVTARASWHFFQFAMALEVLEICVYICGETSGAAGGPEMISAMCTIALPDVDQVSSWKYYVQFCGFLFNRPHLFLDFNF